MTSCTIFRAGDPWWNQTFPEQRGRFHAEFDATPSATNIDTVVGLSDGSATTFSKLAAIVRFNASGAIDARAGDTYRADTFAPYQAGWPYHIRLDVDLRAHTYSVWVAVGAGSTAYARVANNYPFRTEQAGVARLTNVGAKVDAAAGSLELCGFAVVADITTGDGCATASSADGFAPIPIDDSTGIQMLDFTAKASVSPIDAVIGMSAGRATTFSDLATAVRFAPSGNLDVRDGDTYRSDSTQPYGASTWRFRVLADIRTHHYSVFEVHPPESVELARQYAFRTQQAGATHLGYVDLIVDNTPGTIQVCGFATTHPTGIAYWREGDPFVLPLANNTALLSDGATTTRVDASGNVIASYAHGGALAVDVLGNVFIASISGNTLTVEKTDASFTPRWTATATVLAGAQLAALQTDPAGTLDVGIVTPQEGSVSIFAFTAGGANSGSSYGPGMWLALDGDGSSIVAWQDGSTLRITKRAANSSLIWQKSFAGNASVGAMAVAPDHSVVFGGRLGSAIDFGGGAIRGSCNDNAGCLDGFWAELAADGSYVAAVATGNDSTNGIATNGTRIAVSSLYRTQFRYSQYDVYDASGRPITGGAGPFGENGSGGRIAIGSSNRIWWNFLMSPSPVDRGFPFMAVFD